MGLYPAPATALVPPDYTAPTGFTYSTWQRLGWTNVSTAPTSGTLMMTGIGLPAGFRVGKIAYAAGTTAAASPTNWWYGLYDQNRVMLATSANQLTAAFASQGLRSLTIARTAAGAETGFTTTYTGLYYIGFLMTATTMPTLSATIMSTVLGQVVTPAAGGNSSTGLTVPPNFPTTAGAITGIQSPPYATVGT